MIPIEYISGLPISRESLQFRLVECVSDEISSTHILEITNFNETCIKINKSTLNGNVFEKFSHASLMSPSSE